LTLQGKKGIIITNSDGDTVARYSYDAWGKVLSVRDTDDAEITSESHIANINPFRYRSYYFDRETNLYYLQSRYYDAEVGRFVNSDIAEFATLSNNPLLQNLFAYCCNDCVNDCDADGTISWKKIVSCFNTIGNLANKLLNLIIDGASFILGVKESFSKKEISKIAKNVGRSPHRVRQNFDYIYGKVNKLTTKTGRILKALTILQFLYSIKDKISSVKSIVSTIITTAIRAISDGLSALLSWLVNKGIKFVSKFIPAIAGVFGFLLGELRGRIVDVFFNKYSDKVTKKYISKVNIYKFTPKDYFLTFFKCLI